MVSWNFISPGTRLKTVRILLANLIAIQKLMTHHNTESRKRYAAVDRRASEELRNTLSQLNQSENVFDFLPALKTFTICRFDAFANELLATTSEAGVFSIVIRQFANAYIDVLAPISDSREPNQIAPSLPIVEASKPYKLGSRKNSFLASVRRLLKPLGHTESIRKELESQLLERIYYWDWQFSLKFEPPSMIRSLPPSAKIRIQSRKAAFEATFFTRSRDSRGGIEIVVHHFEVVARECISVCKSAQDFEDELSADLVRIIHYSLDSRGTLAGPFVNPSLSGVERIHKAIWQTFLNLRAEAWKGEEERGQITTDSQVAPRLKNTSGLQEPESNLSSATARRDLVDNYIDEVFERTGKQITRKDIWSAAKYKTRTEFEKWQRADKKKVNACAAENIMRVLQQKPHLK